MKHLQLCGLVGLALFTACTDHDLASPGGSADANVDVTPAPMADAPAATPSTDAAIADVRPIPDADDAAETLPSDGSADAAQPTRRIFVTSLVFTGNLGGTVGADATCQMLANAARLPGSYRAWLSTKTEAIRNRSTQAAVPYVRVDGVRVANNWADLVDGSLQNPIILNENGGAEDGDAWTGTTFDGASSPAADCAGYSSDVVGLGHCGNLFSTGAGWTDIFRPSCLLPLHLYCLEQ